MTFPRFSISGVAILVAYFTALKLSFDYRHYCLALKSGVLSSSSSAVLNSIVTSTSLLNVLSHSAVVLGALNDTYILSILLGVGFDVVTRVFRLIWILYLTWLTFHQKVDCGEDYRTHASTFLFLLVLSVSYIVHLTIHIQALQ